MRLTGTAWVLQEVHEASWVHVDLRNPVQKLPLYILMFQEPRRGVSGAFTSRTMPA